MRVFGLIASVAVLALWGCSDKDPMSSPAEAISAPAGKLTVSGRAGGAPEARRSGSAVEGDVADAGGLTISATRVRGENELGGAIAPPPPPATAFTVTIENIAPAFAFAGSGAFNTPVGADGPGPAGPGADYEFTFSARPGDGLSFATMFVQSNDLFYAPDMDGIALWDEGGNLIDGDITDQIMLWDAGTEVNQAPGIGPDQAPRQSGADTGADENGVVQIVDGGFIYPDTDSVIRITISAQ